MTFRPMLDSKDAPALYASADVNVIPLAKGIYRTALPSKTATCLACGKPIIFAIGEESKFGQKMVKEFGCAVVSSETVGQLIEAILANKAADECSKENESAYCVFSRSENSKRYASWVLRE